MQDGRLEISGDGASELSAMNACTLAFISEPGHGKGESKQAARDGKLDVPLYFSPTREKLLAPISINVLGNVDDWVIAGVALFLASD